MKNNRKCLYLCAGMALLLLAACGRRPAQGTAAPATPAAETKTEELPDETAPQAEPEPGPEPTAAPQPEAFTDAQALGDFSEGLAFALVILFFLLTACRMLNIDVVNEFIRSSYVVGKIYDWEWFVNATALPWRA